MSHYVICAICQERFNRDRIQAIKISARRYAHAQCAEDSGTKGELMPVLPQKEKKKTEEKEKKEVKQDEDLVKAIGDAIDKQSAEDGTEYFTDTRNNLYIDTTSTLDFDTLINEFNTIINNIPGSADKTGETTEGKEFVSYWMPRITEIVEKYLGKGKKISQCSRDQVEAVDLIVTDIQDLVKYKTI